MCIVQTVAQSTKEGEGETMTENKENVRAASVNSDSKNSQSQPMNREKNQKLGKINRPPSNAVTMGESDGAQHIERGSSYFIKKNVNSVDANSCKSACSLNSVGSRNSRNSVKDSREKAEAEDYFHRMYANTVATYPMQFPFVFRTKEMWLQWMLEQSKMAAQSKERDGVAALKVRIDVLMTHIGLLELDKDKQNDSDRAEVTALREQVRELTEAMRIQQEALQTHEQEQNAYACGRGAGKGGGCAVGLELLAERATQQGIERGERSALERRFHLQSDELAMCKQELGETKLLVSRCVREVEEMQREKLRVSESVIAFKQSTDEAKYVLSKKVEEARLLQEKTDQELTRTREKYMELSGMMDQMHNRVKKAEESSLKDRANVEYLEQKVEAMKNNLSAEQAFVNEALFKRIRERGTGNGGGDCRDFAGVVYKFLSGYYKRKYAEGKSLTDEQAEHREKVERERRMGLGQGGVNRHQAIDVMQRAGYYDAAAAAKAKADRNEQEVASENRLRETVSLATQAMRAELTALQARFVASEQTRLCQELELERLASVDRSSGLLLNEEASRVFDLVAEIARLKEEKRESEAMAGKQLERVNWLIGTVETHEAEREALLLTEEQKLFNTMVMSGFAGDYVGLTNNSSVVHLMYNWGDEQVLFADFVTFCKSSNGKQDKMILIVSKKSLFFVTRDIKKQVYTLQRQLSIRGRCSCRLID